MTETEKIREERCMTISKSNEMIRNSSYDLSAMEQRIVWYFFSKIKPGDTDLTEYPFEIRHFCEVCGIDYKNGGNYKYLKSIIKGLSDNSFWVSFEDGSDRLCRWVRKAHLNKGKGTGVIKLDEDIQRHALGLIKEGNFTQYIMVFTMPMKGQYSRHLYEILKSREYEINKYNKTFVRYEVKELQRILNADDYVKYNDFKRYVIDYAINEINNYSDLEVSYSEVPLKTGKRGKPPIGHIDFYIKTRDVFDVTMTVEANHNILDRKCSISENFDLAFDDDIEGQMELDDYVDVCPINKKIPEGRGA